VAEVDAALAAAAGARVVAAVAAGDLAAVAAAVATDANRAGRKFEKKTRGVR